MPMRFRCSQCGKAHEKDESWAGKVINCDGCWKGMRIPTPMASAAVAASSPAMGRAGWSGEEIAIARAARGVGAKSSSLWKIVGGGAVGLVILLAALGRFMNGIQRAQRRQEQRQQVAAPNVGVPPAPAPTFDPSPPRGPWRMPEMPELGAGTELEPGVRFHEVRLTGSKAPGQAAMPGHSGKLWLYMPEGEHRPNSLPIILIAGAGSRLVTGMELGEADRPEHLPYVRAGFPVLAYELDGMLPDPAPADDRAWAPYIRSFLDAEAGLVNMRVAMEFARRRVPAIDPRRFIAAGHSSAATLALLVAENEPQLSACVAYAPVADIRQFIPAEMQKGVGALVPGAGQLFTKFNPRDGEANIRCPVFIFFAEDDGMAQQDRALCDRLEAAQKVVTMSTVKTGGHHAPMIQRGIPAAIQWLESIQTSEGTTVVPTKEAPAPKPRMNPPRRPGARPTPGGRRTRGMPKPG